MSLRVTTWCASTISGNADRLPGQFYIGDLADFSSNSYPLDHAESFKQFLQRNPKLTRTLNRTLHTVGEQAVRHAFRSMLGESRVQDRQKP